LNYTRIFDTLYLYHLLGKNASLNFKFFVFMDKT